ncbi:MAG: carboxypeptidase-like regulatory domain-containing protein, partial [Bacteroidales bacterium]|nr:carboxypeptidase-like regulatory domain-containing protein [Bacteroidales bacterium]
MSKIRYTFVILSFVFATVAQGASKHTISGTVIDEASGETLIGATVFDSLSGKGAVTNAYGFFSLTLPDGKVAIKVSFVGYQPVRYTFRLTKDTVLNIKLSGSISLKAVVVTAEREHDLKGVQMSTVDIPLEKIKSMPVLFGEADVVKT